MQTNFTPEQLAKPAFASSNVELSACLQCDYCASNCPTYQMLGHEYDSPRGRVFLIKEMLESPQRPADTTVEHLDRCLSCLACMSTCPSSVHYMHLMDHARAHIEEHYRRPFKEQLLRWMLAKVLPHPGRFRLAMRGARWLKPFSPLMPGRLRGLVALTPHKLPPVGTLNRRQVLPALGERERRVALLTGCAQTAVNSDINEATIRILRRHGCEVVITHAGCCGALTHHMGKMKESHAAAEKNIRAWMAEINGKGLDAVIVNTSGCGTVVKDYGYMFRDHPLAASAETISGLAKDISEVLSELELTHKSVPKLRIAYHATCSLQFGQRIRYTPMKLLKAAGFTVLEPRDAHACCGFAGTYAMVQPEMATQLRQRKVQTLEQINPDAIAVGNIGCMMQISAGSQVPVVHTVELLDWVTGGPMPQALASVGEVSG